MGTHDIRWQQRFENFKKAFKLLEEAVSKYRADGLSELEKQGLIQRFEFTHELAWTVLKDYFEYQGNTNITGSRDASREAFNKGLIQNGDGWMEMIKSRNQSFHTYNDKIVSELIRKITGQYCDLFAEFLQKMDSLRDR